MRFRADQLGETSLMAWLTRPRVVRWLRLVPPLRRLRRPGPWPAQPWHETLGPIPHDLRGAPGIERDEQAADAAFATESLPLWERVHYPVLGPVRARQWKSLLRAAPRLMRAYRRLRPEAAGGDDRVRDTPTNTSTETEALEAEAYRIGISAVGVARYDARYTVDSYQDANVGDRVIVCVQEQAWDGLQSAPSARAQHSAFLADAANAENARRLADFLRWRGHRARVFPPAGLAVAIHYGVAAGLGQLGLNGQLLTPYAGSRCRLILISTNAPLELGEPADYGIPALCDACRACARRCPVGAIPTTRSYHRGVLKAKIRMDRCLPAVAQAQACAVCTKVCPVQRYGLGAVLEEWRRTGSVLGKESDELEGYDWPRDGRHYGPGEKPREAVDPGFLRPAWLNLEYQEIPFGEYRQSGVGSLDTV